MAPEPDNACKPGRVWPTALGCGLAHGAALVAAAPPIGLWGFAFLIVPPLAWCAWLHRDRPIRGALWACLGIAPAWAFEVSWVSPISEVGYPPMVPVLATITALFVWSASRLSRRTLAGRRVPMSVSVPVLWTGFEFVRAELLLGGYPFCLTGHPLIEWSVLSAVGAVGGVHLVTLLIAALAGGLLDFAVTGRRRMGAACIALVVAGFALGNIVRPGGGGVLPGGATGETVRVAVVQTNVPQDNRSAWTVDERIKTWIRLGEMTLEASERSPDLIIWPETMFPGLTVEAEPLRVEREANLFWNWTRPEGDTVQLSTTAFADEFEVLQERIEAPILLGTTGYEGLRIEIPQGGAPVFDQDKKFNSAVIAKAGRIGRRYDKQVLTPFGEVMPLISRWEWLEDQLLAFAARGMAFDLSAGRAPVVLDRTPDDRGDVSTGKGFVATPICFEAAKSSLCRKLVWRGLADGHGAGGRRRADSMVNLTNDGWFSRADWARRQSLTAARWRCIELATPMVRAANTGYSGVIDATGRLLDETPAREEALLIADVPLHAGITVYALIGNVFGWASLAVGAIMLVLARRQTDAAGDDEQG
jgi:apolipoprotein N-acyltransferase